MRRLNYLTREWVINGQLEVKLCDGAVTLAIREVPGEPLRKAWITHGELAELCQALAEVQRFIAATT